MVEIMNVLKSNMKKILNYIIIFVLTVTSLFIALVISANIPRSAIEEKLKESAEFYKRKQAVFKVKKDEIYSYVHYSADAKKLDIIYCIDSEKSVESVLWSKYYRGEKETTNKSFADLVENSKEPNRQYIRYWNGCMLILRPLLTIFNIEQIYLLNIFVLSILGLILFIMLFKRSKKIAFIFLLSLILISVWYVPLCIEYSITFYIMIIASMIILKIEKNKNNKSKDEIDEKISKLFLVTGIITTFFDFLTTEILTVFVPIILILMIRKEEKRLSSLKDTFKFVIKLSILWFVGYCGMWLAKWILASLILNINAIEYVKNEAMLRINGLQGLNNYVDLNNYEELYGNVIPRNLYAIPIMNFIHINFYKISVKILTLIVLFIILIFIDWKELKNKKILLLFMFIGLTPYIRYLILANHSLDHAMFTYRDQIITIMCLIYVIINCFNYKLIKKISTLYLSKKSS